MKLDIILLMNVDLLSIINNTVKEIPFCGKSSFSDDGYVVEWEVSGRAAEYAGSIEITACANAVVKTHCARCAKPVEFSVSVDIAEEVGKDEVEPEGTVLNIDNIVKNNITVELPIRVLCKEDCKGICDICGADLNTTECGCSHEQFDERLAVLKQLLDSGDKPDDFEEV